MRASSEPAPDAEPPSRSERLERLAKRRFWPLLLLGVLLAVGGYVCWFTLGMKAVGAPMLILAGALLILLNYYRFGDLSSLPDGGGPLNV